MKADLHVSGRVELSHTDISKAITEYLVNNYGYKVERVVYPDKHTPIVVAEIKGVVLTHQHIPEYNIPEKQVRQLRQARVVKNIGVFDTIRAILNDAFIKNDKKETVVPYFKLRTEVFSYHPSMDDKKLRIYLSDSRQLSSNVVWSAKTNEIVVRSIINH